jgi:hypothetical protein
MGVYEQPVLRMLEDAVMGIAPLTERVHVHDHVAEVRHVVEEPEKVMSQDGYFG